MNTQIQDKRITDITKGGFKGWVKLTDKSVTHFEVDSSGEYTQWGNTPENQLLSVPLMERLSQMIVSE